MALRKDSKQQRRGGAASDRLGAGDSFLLKGILPEDEAAAVFATVDAEVTWATVHHRGGLVPRLMAIQGSRTATLVPVYRHPMDDEPQMTAWTPAIARIREAILESLRARGHEEKLNHVLVQKYRDGEDFISAHSDKTLDVERHSVIVNYSMGSERVLDLKRKTPIPEPQAAPTTTDATTPAAASSVSAEIVVVPLRYERQKVALAHNSLFVMGARTNAEWLHSIPRQPHVLGARISLTFRSIATFWDTNRQCLVGQGAALTPPLREGKQAILQLVRAFGEENTEPQFDWDRWYGPGFSCSSVPLSTLYPRLTNSTPPTPAPTCDGKTADIY